MKSEKLRPSRVNFLKSTKIEVFQSLSERFGSNYGIPSQSAGEIERKNFQLDRLFTIIHDN